MASALKRRHVKFMEDGTLHKVVRLCPEFQAKKKTRIPEPILQPGQTSTTESESSDDDQWGHIDVGYRTTSYTKFDDCGVTPGPAIDAISLVETVEPAMTKTGRKESRKQRQSSSEVLILMWDSPPRKEPVAEVMPQKASIAIDPIAVEFCSAGASRQGEADRSLEYVHAQPLLEDHEKPYVCTRVEEEERAHTEDDGGDGDIDDGGDYQSSGEEYRVSKQERQDYKDDQQDDIKDAGEEDDREEPEEASDGEDGQTEGEDEDNIRKKRRHIRRYKGGPTKNTQKQCPECDAQVVNINRHLENVHGWTKQDIERSQERERIARKTPLRDYGGKKACCLCQSVVLRMDMHLIRTHKLLRGSDDFQEATILAEEFSEEKKAQQDLDKALSTYTGNLKDRASGKRRCAATAAQHVTAVRTFLTSLTNDSIDGLNRIGQKTGTINQILESKKIKPESIKIYLHHLANFIDYLSSSAQWCRHLTTTPGDLKIVANKMRQMAKSLTEDINKAKVEKMADEEDLVNIEPWMVGKYMTERPPAVSDILANGDLNKAEVTEVRDSLCLQLLLDNAKRAGDISHLKVKTIMKATIPAGKENVEVFVAQHKEARSGKRCPIKISSQLLLDIKIYITQCRRTKEDDASDFSFLTLTGEIITPSTMSKLLNKEWERFAKSVGEDWPKLTASRNRKLAVTTAREMGADRSQQEALAKHMAHRVETADRYYDKSVQEGSRHQVISGITEQYKEAAAAKRPTKSPCRKTTPRGAKSSCKKTPPTSLKITSSKLLAKALTPKLSAAKRKLPF